MGLDARAPAPPLPPPPPPLLSGHAISGGDGPGALPSGSTLTFRGGTATPSRAKLLRAPPAPRMRAALSAALAAALKLLALAGLVALFVSLGARASDARPPPALARRAPPAFAPIAERRADFDVAPRHCEALKKHPAAFDKSCKRRGLAEEAGNFSCDDGRVLMFSQFRQDYYLYRYHFARLRRAGNYLDVAANEPIGLSNTYFMDRCLGWAGVCAEANPRYFEKLYRLRSCRLLPTCASDAVGQNVEFILKGGSGGIEGTNKGAAHWRSTNDKFRTTKLRCTTLAADLLRARVNVIDYLSLDVEGHELHVLKGIDWTTTRFNVMTIEVSKQSYDPIREFLEARGYREITELPDGATPRVAFGGDVLFVHNDVVFGSPE